MGCCWKWKVLLLTCAQISRTKGHWLTMNLAAMTKAIKAQLPTLIFNNKITLNLITLACWFKILEAT